VTLSSLFSRALAMSGLGIAMGIMTPPLALSMDALPLLGNEGLPALLLQKKDCSQKAEHLGTLPPHFDNFDLLPKSTALASQGSMAVSAEKRRFAFVTVSLQGHMRPATSIAAEMARRGFAVDFLVAAAGAKGELLALEREQPLFSLHAVEDGQEMIADMDWKAVACSTGRIGGSKVALMEQLAKLKEGDISPAVAQWKAMIRILERCKPDVVILDHSLMVLQMWAEDNCIPTIILHTPYFTTAEPSGCARMSRWQQLRLMKTMLRSRPMDFIQKAKKELGVGVGTAAISGIQEGASGSRQAQGLSPHTFVFCEPELLNKEHVPNRVHVVGPCFSVVTSEVEGDLLHWLDDAAANGENVLYVSFGTLANGFLNSRAIIELMAAFSRLGSGWRVLWSLPAAQHTLLPQSWKTSPAEHEKLRIESFVCQRGVLAHSAVKVFLTHGGQSSVNEGISAGLPLVCLPLFCDQFEMADSIESHGLGLVFHKDELLSFWGGSGRLAQLLHRAAKEPQFRDAAARYGHLMRIRAGCSRAADVIESVAFGGVDFQELWAGPKNRTPAWASSRVCGAGILTCFQGLFSTSKK